MSTLYTINSVGQVSVPRNITVLEFIYAFLLLVPGFLSYKISIWRSANTYTSNNFEELAWSLLGSGISLSAFYIFYLMYVQARGVTNELLVGGQLNLGVLAPVYLVVLVIAILLGFIGGWGHDNVLHRKTGIDSDDSWKKFMSLLYRRKRNFDSNPPKVRIVTTDNGIYEGYITHRGAGYKDEPADLLLASTSHTDESDTSVEYNVYNYVYFPEDEIAQIETDADLYWFERTTAEEPSEEETTDAEETGDKPNGRQETARSFSSILSRFWSWRR